MHWAFTLTTAACLTMTTGCGGCGQQPALQTVTVVKKEELKPVSMPIGAERVKLFMSQRTDLEHRMNEWIEAENPEILSIHMTESAHFWTALVRYKVTKAPAPKQ